MGETENTGFITVRTSSTRLLKCLLPLGDETVISHVVKRSISYGIEPIICTSTDISDDVLEGIATQLGVKCFRGSLVNKLKRWLDCADISMLMPFIRLMPMTPYLMVRNDHSLDLLRSKDCDVVCPTETSSAGGQVLVIH